MTRGALAVTAAAVALVLGPAAAMVQAAAPQASAPQAAVMQALAGSGFSVADSSPATGVPFTVRASGARANESVTLRITRRPASNGSHPRSLTKSANASGVVEFVVTIAEDGTYALASTSASGSTLSRQSVTVVDQGSVIVAGEGAAASSAGAAASGAGAAASRAGAAASSVGSVPRSVGSAASSAGSVPVAAPRVADRLASTGSPGLGLAGGGGVLVLAGAGLVKVARRRETTRAPG